MIVSLFCIILHYPVSLISLVVPIFVTVHAILSLKSCDRRNLWPCAFSGFVGLLVKFAAIIVFFNIFPVDAKPTGSKVMLWKLRDGMANFVL
ncbi:unnamed protein product [Dracunculus medinensis]|uniref:Uncharacterized protein n=1 Tax=Dracunculus medinensis TaxID=318479 RepID=A0A3P7Q256_DRAME|nr:unnamed protein product [Dracunculus medinensis]